VPAGLGCLVALVAMPLALLAGVLAGLGALLSPRRRGAAPQGPAFGSTGRRSVGARAAGGLGATGIALCSLVEKMSLDAEFGLEDAQTAGIPVDTDASIEALLVDAVERGWIDRRGDRFAVTPRGRNEAGAFLRQMDV